MQGSEAVQVKDMGSWQQLSRPVMRQKEPDYDPETAYLKSVRNLADTLHRTLIFYSSLEAERWYNADDAGEYMRACTVAYDHIYTENKVVFLAKRQKGYATITFLYTKEREAEVDQLIAATRGMLRYVDWRH